MMAPYKKIVLLDLNGTLIDDEYRLTVSDERIKTAIKNIQDNDVAVGINSDTSFLQLQSWARDLGMRGPLIAEKGQVLALSPDEPPQLPGAMLDFFQRLREQIVLRVHKEFPRAFVGLGDVTMFLHQRGQIYGEDRLTVLINGYRQCSFSGYALARRNNKLVKDAEIFDSFCNLVFSIVGDSSEKLEEDKNQDYGFLMLHERGASKTLAIERLVEQLGSELEYIMIGDGDSDIITARYPVKLCAVSNASPALKKRVEETGGIIAKESLTQGVVELLTRLLVQLT